MTSDDRVYIELRFDMRTCDVVLVAFEESPGYTTNLFTKDWTFDLEPSRECSTLDDVKDLLVQIVEEL